AVCVGTARPQDSYLNMKNILAAAIGTGAEAIHPGFGFLSENSQFVEMCEAVGITFIGPNSEIIDLMRNKANAREQMQKSGVQVISDKQGNVVYFPERDWSVQRNKQKMIEESPCLLITEDQRKELGNIAIKAANAINYVNTGTIEFLMDSQHNFYFMEMNTRIQVEHTVTEMVTGIDLVKAQVKVASGERLPFNQNDIQINGSAIECRINAEDPSKNFMPQVGKVRYLYFPVGNLGMRIDSDLYAGWEITPFYDSMIA